MNTYRFWMVGRPTTPYETLTYGEIMANNLEDAVRYFCMQHNYRLIESDDDAIWVEDRRGADMKYSISW